MSPENPQIIKGAEVEVELETIDIQADHAPAGAKIAIDVIRINGLAYSGEYFRIMAEPDPTRTYKLVRDGELTTITDIASDELALAIVDRLDEVADRLADPDLERNDRPLNATEAAPLVNEVLRTLAAWPPKLEGWRDKATVTRRREILAEARRLRQPKGYGR